MHNPLMKPSWQAQKVACIYIVDGRKGRATDFGKLNTISTITLGNMKESTCDDIIEREV